MDWGTVFTVLVAMAIFMGAVMLIFGMGGVLMMRLMFRKTAEAPKCPIPGCPFAKAMEKALMEDALHEARREEPMGEVPHEAEREKVAV